MKTKVISANIASQIDNIYEEFFMRLMIILGMMLSIAIQTASADTNKERAMSSKKVVKEFMGQLKGELEKAMKSSGPVAAIEVCNTKAPEIAKGLSEKYGWKVARTSLKTRNTSNKPDAWETQVLQKFEQRKAAGEDVKPMAYFETVNGNFRFMKAIPTGEVCLKCHGEKIDPKITAKLDELYPADKARGFKLGDIRGAFTITHSM